MISSSEKLKFSDYSLPNTQVTVMRVGDYEIGDMHTHEFIEIAFVFSGTGWHILGDRVSRCGPGSLFIINCDDAHMFASDPDNSMQIYNLIFQPGFFDLSLLGRQSFADVARHFLLRTFQYDDFSHSLAVEFSKESLPAIHRLFESMLTEYTHHEPGFEELIRAWTIELLVYIFRQLRATENLSSPPPQLKTDMLESVFRYIQQNYMEPISLEKLSMLAFLSPKYFSRLFKAHTGLTVTEYTQKLRIDRACEILAASNASIAEIAAQTGYSDVKYFTRVFRRVLAVSPTEYRRMRRTQAQSPIPETFLDKP